VAAQEESNDEVRDFWFHLAAGLNFHQFGPAIGVLASDPSGT